MKIIVYILSLLLILDIYGSFKVKDGQVILENLDGYTLCQKSKYSGVWCHDALVRYVDQNQEVAWPAALLTRRNMNSWASIPLFSMAKDSKEFNCQSEDLLLALKSAYVLTKKNKKIIDKAHDIAFSKCTKVIPYQLKDVLNVKSYAFQKYCQDFIKLNTIKGVLRKKCIKINK
jgi:hypothetical protein